MRRRDGPSVALGAAAIVALAAVFIAARMVYDALFPRTSGGPEVCCRAPVEVVDDDGQRLGCVTDAALAGCGTVHAGDRVVRSGEGCRVEPNAMATGMRVLSGLKLDVNSATVGDLMQIDAIGAQLAESIVATRTVHGPFRRIDELADLRGVGPVKLAELHKHLEIRSAKGVGD